jgi:broad specificity phosphatase PhoE
MTRLVLCRHAEEGNIDQARGLAATLAAVPLAAVYTSPLTRAAVTAEAVAAVHALVAVEIADLREIEFGEVDGLAFEQYPEHLREELLRRPLSVRFPGGETYGELRERVCRALDDIVASHRNETVAIVSHAGPVRAALASWLGIADQAIFRIDQRFASVNVVDWLEGVALVQLVNGTQP